MPRPRNPTLMSAWKLYMPATLTSRVELLLYDPLTGKAKHGERARITTLLWEEYLSRISGQEADGHTIISLPRLEDATFELEGFRVTYRDLLRHLKSKEAAVGQPN